MNQAIIIQAAFVEAIMSAIAETSIVHGIDRETEMDSYSVAATISVIKDGHKAVVRLEAQSLPPAFQANENFVPVNGASEEAAGTPSVNGNAIPSDEQEAESTSQPSGSFTQ